MNYTIKCKLVKKFYGLAQIQLRVCTLI